MSITTLETWQIDVLNTVSMLILFTAAIIALTRNMLAAIKTYIVQAGLLVAMFLTIGLKYEWFLGWSMTAIITKVIIVPWMLYWIINKTKYITEEEEPMIPLGAYILLLAFVYAISLIVAGHIVSIAHFPSEVGERPLVTSLALVMLGLSVITVARNAFKQIMGILLFENGSHILLASMAFYVPETVEIGITTDAVAFIAILVLLAYKMVKIKADMDVSKLATLKY